jgi:competence protein ComEA
MGVVGLLGVCLAAAFYRQGATRQADFVIAGRPAPESGKAFPVVASQPQTAPAGSPAPVEAEPKELLVHVAGAVNKPDLYRLRPGDRVADALKAAGGPKFTADLDAVNLAARVEDGQKLLVPMKSAGPAPALPAGKRAQAPAAPVKPQSEKSDSQEKLSVPGEGWVNINTASEEELQRLPRVGPGMSARIIQYRKEIGSFQSPEQLMDVSGIGEKTFAKIQPFVRVR